MDWWFYFIYSNIYILDGNAVEFNFHIAVESALYFQHLTSDEMNWLQNNCVCNTYTTLVNWTLWLYKLGEEWCASFTSIIIRQCKKNNNWVLPLLISFLFNVRQVMKNVYATLPCRMDQILKVAYSIRRTISWFSSIWRILVALVGYNYCLGHKFHRQLIHQLEQLKP